MAENVQFFTFDDFVLQLAKGKTSVLDLTADTLAVYLTNNTPNVTTHTKLGDLAGITTGGGYSGPVNLTISSRGITSNGYYVIASDVEWTGAGSGFGPFRYVILYDVTSNPTDSERKLLGYWAYSSSQTVTAGNPFKVDFSATNGVLKLIRGTT
jgi:hypothetical protein